MTDTLICDTECYPNLWCIGFRRATDGKTLVLAQHDEKELDRERLRRLMLSNKIVTYNGLGYDRAMIWGAISGLSNEKLKEMNDRIIMGGVRWWEVENVLNEFVPGFGRMPDMNFVDLMEPQPNAFASLKTLGGRMHARKLQDLPYKPHHVLTKEQIANVISYMGNDLETTHLLYDNLREPLELREAISKELGDDNWGRPIDLRSKSDTQVGFAILKKRLEDVLGRRLSKPVDMTGHQFQYTPPEFIKFKTPELQALLEQIKVHTFKVKANGRVDLPKFLSEKIIQIGDMGYQMGIGGLHSTEANRSVYSSNEDVLIDVDVGSFYPAIILLLKLFPPSMGPLLLEIYRAIRQERMEAKRLKMKSKAEGLKISLNGFFGLTSNPYSPAYSPPMTIAITLTGQLAILMLIEAAHLEGIPAKSANTDGVTFLVPGHKYCYVDENSRLVHQMLYSKPDLKHICDQWEANTGFDLEFVEYRSLHNLSVNTYFAIKPDGKVKRKGTLSNPWADPNAIREQLMKNPNMTICADAALAYIKEGTPIEDTILNCTDFRQFVTVVNVKGGGMWSGREIPKKSKNEEQSDYEARFGKDQFEVLGKVVRYYWGENGAPIYYCDPHETTGNFKKVSQSDGSVPAMELPDQFPPDVDYVRYIAEAKTIVTDVGVGDFVVEEPIALRPPTAHELVTLLLSL